jgi:hypothetical protein
MVIRMQPWQPWQEGATSKQQHIASLRSNVAGCLHHCLYHCFANAGWFPWPHVCSHGPDFQQGHLQATLWTAGARHTHSTIPLLPTLQGTAGKGKSSVPAMHHDGDCTLASTCSILVHVCNQKQPCHYQQGGQFRWPWRAILAPWPIQHVKGG